MANGGDKTEPMKHANNIQSLHLMVRDALIKQLRGGQTKNAILDGRIKQIK